jgi:hypothetical protein
VFILSKLSANIITTSFNDLESVDGGTKVGVGGIGVEVGGFVDVAVGIGVSEGGKDVRVGGTEVETTAQLIEMIKSANETNTD